MVYIRVNNLQVGDILSKTIYNEKMQIMLKEDNELSEADIERIKLLDYKGVYIESLAKHKRENIQFPEPILEDTDILRMMSIMKKATKNKDVFTDPFNVDFAKIRKSLEEEVTTIVKIIKERDAKGDFLYEIEDNRNIHNSIFYHSINTCLISAGIAYKMGFNDEEIKNIAIAGLYHDFGKILLSDELRNKKIDDEKVKQIIRQHPEKCFRLFQKLNYPTSTIYGIWQHHEKIDGSGYPHRLKDEKITVAAKIVALASAFDNLINIQPYNPSPMKQSEALEYINGCGLYDINCILALLKFIVPYPVGTKVRLSNGETGIILKNNASVVLRPYLIVGNQLYDLASNMSLMNITIVDDKIE